MWISEVVPVSTRVLGFDMLAKTSDTDARLLASLGLSFGVRYVDLVQGITPLTLDPVELDVYERAALALMTVQFGRSSGWSLATGTNDGRAAAQNHLALGLPDDGTLSCDLEGRFASASQIIDYGSAWYQAAVREGMKGPALQVYCGEGVELLSSVQLFDDLPFQGYWRSASDVPNVAHRGYRMIQLAPLDLVISGVEIDLDVVQTDFKGGRPRWMRSSGALPPALNLKTPIL